MFRISGFSFLGKRIGAENNTERNAIPEQINCEAAPTSEVKTLLTSILFIVDSSSVSFSLSSKNCSCREMRCWCLLYTRRVSVFVEAKDIFHGFSVEVARNESSGNRTRKKFIAKDSKFCNAKRSRIWRTRRCDDHREWTKTACLD